MTYHIAVVFPAAIHFASDRLVTLIPGGPSQATPVVDHDRAANKTVLLACRDGYAVIGYTGVAYLGESGQSTDTFIAQSLYGAELPPPGTLALVGSEAAQVPSLGFLFRRLRIDLDRALAQERLPDRATPFEVLAVGWRVSDRPRLRTRRALAWWLHRKGREPLGWQRNWLPFATTVVDAPGLMGPARAQAFGAAHHAASPETAMQVLVDEIKRVSGLGATAGGRTVGRSVMTVTLPSSSIHPIAAVAYLADPAGDELVGSTSYSPWIVSGDNAVAPGVIRSTAPGDSASPVMEYPFGRCHVSIHGHHGGNMTIRRQERPGPPR